VWAATIARRRNLLHTQVEQLTDFEICREAAQVQWANVIESAQHVSAESDPKERKATLRRLRRSPNELDRYIAQVVDRWDAASKNAKD
jgi:hypothetical protein